MITFFGIFVNIITVFYFIFGKITKMGYCFFINMRIKIFYFFA